MKRYIDKKYFQYSAFSAYEYGIEVKCPKVKVDKNTSFFKCFVCGDSKEADRTIYRYDVHNQCKICGRHYRVDIVDKGKQHYKTAHVHCPYCDSIQSGDIHKTAEKYKVNGEIKKGIEPYFGYELYYIGNACNHLIWAVNREHLQYLIDYLSAGLREKPKEGYLVMKTQADALPTFMKLAKNRERIVKELKKMQLK